MKVGNGNCVVHAMHGRGQAGAARERKKGDTIL